MDVIYIVSFAFMIWMSLDCIQRKEHFVWIIIIIFLGPIGAVVYYFAVKSKATGQGGPKPIKIFSPSSPPREVETEETLQLKELIEKFKKAYHYEKLGQAYLDQKKYRLAIPQFEEAVKKDPEMNDARYGIAKSHHALGQYDEAAKILEELIAIDKKFDYGNAIFGLAECYRMGGHDDKALKTYKEVIDSFAFFKAYYHYGRLLDRLGNKQEAIAQMKSLIGSSKDLPEYKLEKERYWIEEAYKFLKKNGIELA